MDILADPLFFIPILIGIGVIAGIIVGIMGGSGVVAVVPLLTILGLDVHTSIGTSLLIDVIASTIAAYTYGQNKHLDLSQGIWMAITAVIGAQIGSFLANKAPSVTMNWGFGLYLIINGIVILKTGMKTITDKVSGFANSKFLKGGLDTPEGNRRANIISAAAGLVIGVISGFVGAGGGMMFLFVLLLVLGMELHMAIGTSTLIMAITAASGTIGYAIQGNVYWLAGIFIAIGSIFAVRIGAKAANKMNVDALGRIIAIILIVLGVMMVVMGLY